MTTRVTVSPSEVLAARLVLKRAAEFGREVSPAIKAIAAARRPSRSATAPREDTDGSATDRS